MDVDPCGLDPLQAAANAIRRWHKTDPAIRLDGSRIPIGLHDQNATEEQAEIRRSCEM